MWLLCKLISKHISVPNSKQDEDAGHDPVRAHGRPAGLPLHGRAGSQGQVHRGNRTAQVALVQEFSRIIGTGKGSGKRKGSETGKDQEQKRIRNREKDQEQGKGSGTGKRIRNREKDL